ncbi:MAG: LuxR family transcriptional regulator [Acidimicrobiales bacterium]|nr:LuxR family transcriptional regulator [Acidimicrobiales bacterium]
MVGRSATLARLRSVVDMGELHSSDLPSVALITGEAGIGKTRLLREMLATLPADVSVFSAAAEPQAAARAFDVAGQLAPVDAAEEPGASVLRAIAEAVGHGRVAVVIEDLHWIDADSVTVLDAIARQPWPNLVMFATYRPSDLSRGSPGGDFVLRLERRNEVEQFRLDRLDRGEVGALMGAISGATVSSAAVEAVHRRSGGVPFVVEELMRCAGPEACSVDIISAQLPWSLEEAVSQQLAGLTDAERTIVDALAVFGQPAGFDALTTITGLDERDLLGHLRPMVNRGVISEIRNDRLWFNHALMGDSVRQQLLGRERRRLHDACFAAVAALAPDDHAALAQHAQGAGRYDEVVEIARVGAHAYLQRGATFQALRLASQGLAEDPDDPTLLGAATPAAWRLDFVAEALEYAARWVRVAPTLADRIDAMRFVARLHDETGDRPAADATIAELTALVASLPPGAELARAEAALAQLLMLRHDRAAEGWARLAIEHAVAAGDVAVRVQAEVEMASSLSRHASAEVALVALRAVIVEARNLGDGVLLSRALNNSIDLISPRSPESAAIRDELRRTAIEHGLDKLGHRTILWHDAFESSAVGDLATTKRLIDEWASWTPLPMRSVHYQAQLATIAVEEGRSADAAEIFAVMDLSADAGCDDEMLVAWLSLAALVRDAALGRAVFDVVVQSTSQADGWHETSKVVRVVSAALEVGIGAGEIRERLIRGRLAGHPSHDRLARAAEGLLAQAEDRPVAAIEVLSDVLARADESVTRWLEGSMRVCLAQALLAAGRRSDALAEATRAVEVLERWPGWRRDRAEALLARLAGSTVRSIGQLTTRENEVALLIADGLTNGQLAERLFISPKTAAVHVSNILAKLGLSSRTEIAAWAIRRELPQAG